MAANLVLALTLAMLVPLHQTVPYVIQQDPDTGRLSALQPVSAGALTQQESLIQYQLVQYVQHREGYDRGSIRNAVQHVFFTSAGDAWTQYNETLADGHPENPVRKYGNQATVSVRVKSVSMVGENAASIRFSTTKRAGGLEQEEHWITFVNYRFTEAPLAQEVRFINPLGFQVTTYRKSSEVLDHE